MPDVAKRWTREEVLALPDDGNRYELINGELLVTPAPRSLHQDAVLTLYRRLFPYITAHHVGHLCAAPADLDLRRDQLVQPDLFVVPLVEDRKPMKWREYDVPLLVVEVLSPSTARHDRTTKRAEYQGAGVADYWIMDLDGRLIERWHPADARPELVTARLTWLPDAGKPPLTLDLHEYFAEVWGER